MNAETFHSLRRDFMRALRPPERLDMVDWIEATVRLAGAVSAEPGPMRLMPWQREVARSMGDPNVERVTLLKSARVGATQLMVAGMAHYALNDPAPQLVVMPSESDCKMMLTGIIEPTFAASPKLRNALSENVSGRDTMLSRHYPGGSLALVSGGSPKNLGARTARVLWLDEVDGLDLSAGEDGDPVGLAIRRTMTFGARRKIVMASTPVDERTSRILRAYNEGDMRVWELPCLHCDTFHELRWSMIQWPEGRPELAYFACPECGAITEEKDKPAMIERGRWRATNPEVQGHHSYRLNTFGASTLSTASWGQLAVEFTAARKDPHLLKTWVNTVAGEAWRDDSEGMDESDLLKRREPIGLDRIPPEVIAITGGCDVQRDRVEVTTLGWTADGAPLVLEHAVIWGDPFGPDLWLELSELVARKWTHELGGTLKYDAFLIDSSDGATVNEVYEWTRGRAPQGIFPCKGYAGFKQPAIADGNAGGKRWVRLKTVGVDPLKRRVMDWATAGTMRFSDSLPESWFDQLTAERLVTRYRKGVPVLEWHQVRKRNEALDCVVYAAAARRILDGGWNPEARLERLSSKAAPRKAPRVTHSPLIGDKSHWFKS